MRSGPTSRGIFERRYRVIERSLLAQHERSAANSAYLRRRVRVDRSVARGERSADMHSGMLCVVRGRADPRPGPRRPDAAVALRRAFSEGLPLDHLKTIHSAGAEAAIAPDILDARLADEQVEREAKPRGGHPGSSATSLARCPSNIAT